MYETTKAQQGKEALVRGVTKGWYGFVWMIKIIIPISFATALLAWSGWMEYLNFLIQPVMDIVNLPSIAALPLIIGMLTGIYGGVASMAVLPLTMNQMILVATFLLIAHNLIQEGAIQGKSGIHPLEATLFRLVVATMTVFIVAQFLDMSSSIPQKDIDSATFEQPLFITMLRDWGTVAAALIGRIFFIIMFILTVLEVMKSFDGINQIVRLLSPLLHAMGLSRRVGILWLTAIIFGLAYGGAVIVEEVKNGNLSKGELEELHLSIGINHAMIEDPALFLPLGIHPFWLWVPRLAVAIVAVRILTLWQLVRTRYRSPSQHP